MAFIGRLEMNKGCQEFVSAVIELLKAYPEAVDAVLIGDGSLRSELEEKTLAEGAADHIKFIGQVPHNLVPAWLEIAGVYVSLNHFGGLSNANLEAIAAGKCVVILDKDEVTHTDDDTDEVLPMDCVVRISRHNIKADLVNVLTNLVEKPEQVMEYARRARETASSFQDWEQRVAREIALLGA